MTFNEHQKEWTPSDKIKLIQTANHLLTSPVRFPIMLILYTHTKVTFSELQTLLQLTAGNLDHHLKKLEEANYVVRRKELFPKRTQTMIRITKKGNDSFREYSHRLRAVLNKIE
ncbi:MAG: transcriptional regulator [Candidatus Hodarchaeota archaeon]